MSGLTPYEAAGKLIADMGLTVTAEIRLDVQPGTRQRSKRERMEQQQFHQAVTRREIEQFLSPDFIIDHSLNMIL